MNWFDIVVAIPLLWALWRGFNHGLIQQLLSIVALAGGVWLAMRWGGEVGEALGIEARWSAVGGFVCVFVAVLIVMTLVGRFTRGLFSIAGLGVFDTLLGVVFSVGKVWVVVSLLLHGLVAMPFTQNLLGSKLPEKSLLYTPLVSTADVLFPYIDFAKESLYEAEDTQPQTQPAEQNS